MKEIKFYKSKLKIFRLSFYCSFFWIAAFWNIFFEHNHSFGMWFLFLLCSIPFVTNTVEFLNNRAALIVDHQGITGSLVSDAKISWKHIDDVYQMKYKEHKTLVLVTKPSFQSKNEWKRQNEIDRHFNIDISNLNVEPEKLVLLIKGVLNQSAETKEKTI